MKMGLLQRKFAPFGGKFFPFRVEPSEKGSSFKGKNMYAPFREQTLSFQSRTFSRGGLVYKKANRMSQKVSPIV